MSLQTNFSSPCLEAGLTKQILKQTNVACIPKHKRKFCRDHHLTFLCSSLLQTDLCLNGKVKFGGKKISNNNFRTITQRLLSSSFAFLLQYGLRFTADSFPVVSQSIIILQREKRGQGESEARMPIQIQVTGDELGFTVGVAPSSRFFFLSCCFCLWSSQFSSPCFHDHGALQCVP